MNNEAQSHFIRFLMTGEIEYLKLDMHKQELIRRLGEPNSIYYPDRRHNLLTESQPIEIEVISRDTQSHDNVDDTAVMWVEPSKNMLDSEGLQILQYGGLEITCIKGRIITIKVNLVSTEAYPTGLDTQWLQFIRLLDPTHLKALVKAHNIECREAILEGDHGKLLILGTFGIEVSFNTDNELLWLSLSKQTPNWNTAQCY